MKLKYLKSGELAEKSIQQLVLKYIKAHPHLNRYFDLIIHYPSEGKRSIYFGRLLKSLGMKKGVVDLFIAVTKRGYGGAWIELKSADGVLTKEQKKFLADMKEQNFFTFCAWSVEEAIDILEWYLLA